MNADGKIKVAVLGSTVYIKPLGYATQDNSLGLPGFLQAMSRQGCKQAIFDLADCQAMDSTFLGVIASAAMSCVRGDAKNVLILNANEEARRELQLVGLLPKVALKEEECELPEEIEFSQVDFVHLPNDERERVKRIKELHEELIKLNERNKENFASFVEMLNKELQED
ncbi:MAG: STAS domain-containing protein [Planctomycetes bacterium]|nr:STAS domain-containing protein [Planctomycetota bacterium]